MDNDERLVIDVEFLSRSFSHDKGHLLYASFSMAYQRFIPRVIRR